MPHMQLEKKIHNIRFALNGIRIAWQEEFSFKVQIYAAALILLLGWFFSISVTEWLMVIFMIGIVLSAEIFNTALEELCDKYQADMDPHIGKIKDLSAAAVLVASATALIVGIVIFIPHLFSFA